MIGLVLNGCVQTLNGRVNSSHDEVSDVNKDLEELTVRANQGEERLLLLYIQEKETRESTLNLRLIQ